ncbi:MAG: MBL fold metallo-hydrolase [Alphaproteobacteria bacterium]|nr:MBL fold metallo-hydrolase [Alphaproteobacteria bacterium]
MIFRQLFDRESCTYTYLLADEQSRQAVLIDPVRPMLERDLQVIEDLGLTLVKTLETHIHADHVTSSGLFRKSLGSQSVVSAAGGASCADVLVEDGDVVKVGEVELEVRQTPGHTDGCVAYVDHQGRRVFTGDTLMVRGCGRTDFQQGSARTLYQSVHGKLFTLPDDYAVYPGHDYKGRTMSTVAEEKALNPRLGGGRTVEEFVAIMDNLKLGLPAKIDVAVPANLQCGLLPEDLEQAAAEAAARAGWAPVIRSSEGVPEVTCSWVHDHLGSFRLVDCRQLGEWKDALGHIEGAELRTLGDALVHAAQDWDKTAPVVVYCRSGGRSGRAALVLEDLGFQKVASMQGGMLDWNAQGRPVEGASAGHGTGGSCG